MKKKTKELSDPRTFRVRGPKLSVLKLKIRPAKVVPLASLLRAKKAA